VFLTKKSSLLTVQDFLLLEKDLPPSRDKSFTLKASLSYWDHVVEYSALAKRGWVLQERMLALRTLFWTEDGLFWQCNGFRAAEFGTTLEWIGFRPQFPSLQQLATDLKKDHSTSLYQRHDEAVIPDADFPNNPYPGTKILE